VCGGGGLVDPIIEPKDPPRTSATPSSHDQTLNTKSRHVAFNKNMYLSVVLKFLMPKLAPFVAKLKYSGVPIKMSFSKSQ
jgi:hypothetical protein